MVNVVTADIPDAEVAPRVKKQRHGLLTAWLTFVINANIVAMIMWLAQAGQRTTTMIFPAWMIPVYLAAGVVSIVFIVALLQWKKWGFYGYVGLGIVMIAVSLAAGLNAVLSLSGLVGLAILYTLLQIGGERKAWTQLD